MLGRDPRCDFDLIWAKIDIAYDIMIVVDRDVTLSGCRSRNGASFMILRRMLTGDIAFAASPALILEHEDDLKRRGLLGAPPSLSEGQVDQILDAICAQAYPSLPWFRFRPFLNDPKDDLIIECALAAGVRTIVSNDRAFRHPAVPAFGIRAIPAGQFIAELNRERMPK
jgi:predicted nucleic acid-binding protein